MSYSLSHSLKPSLDHAELSARKNTTNPFVNPLMHCSTWGLSDCPVNLAVSISALWWMLAKWTGSTDLISLSCGENAPYASYTHQYRQDSSQANKHAVWGNLQTNQALLQTYSWRLFAFFFIFIDLPSLVWVVRWWYGLLITVRKIYF